MDCVLEMLQIRCIPPGTSRVHGAKLGRVNVFSQKPEKADFTGN